MPDFPEMIHFLCYLVYVTHYHDIDIFIACIKKTSVCGSMAQDDNGSAMMQYYLFVMSMTRCTLLNRVPWFNPSSNIPRINRIMLLIMSKSLGMSDYSLLSIHLPSLVCLPNLTAKEHRQWSVGNAMLANHYVGCGMAFSFWIVNV